MTEAKYLGNFSPVLAENWVDNVPTYYSYYNFHMRRKAAKKKLHRERMLFAAISVLVSIVCMFLFALRPMSRETYDNNIRYAVESGDTLWSIANEYKDENTSTGEFVYEIKKINGLSSSAINVGDLIIIPE